MCLTEHFNTLQFADVYGYIASVSRRTGDTLELENGLKIFPGMETDVAEGGHILSIGPLEAILELNCRLEPNKEKGCFLSFARLMDLFEEYPVVVGCGHPFRAPGHVPELPEEQLRRLKFLDLNGKDLALDQARTERLTYALGRRLDIPVVSGSDTHQAVQYGCVTTVFERECNTIRPSMRRCGRPLCHPPGGHRPLPGAHRLPAEAVSEGDPRLGRRLCGYSDSGAIA